MNRAKATLAVGVAIAAGILTLQAGPARSAEAPSCRPLVDLIEREIATSDRYVHQSRDLSRMDPAVLEVINIVPYRFVSDTTAERVSCWRRSAGRVADMRAREAAGRASDVALEHLEFLITRGEPVYFSDLTDTLMIERATGFDGPVSNYLRRRGDSQFLRNGVSYVDDFKGQRFVGYSDGYSLERALTELAALCLMHPHDFSARVQALGYPTRLLEPNPSKKVGKGDDPAYLAYLDSERDRIVRDCPT